VPKVQNQIVAYILDSIFRVIIKEKNKKKGRSYRNRIECICIAF